MKLFSIMFLVSLYALTSFKLQLSADEQKENILPSHVVIIDAKETNRQLIELRDTDGTMDHWWWELRISYNLTLLDNSSMQLSIFKRKGKSLSLRMEAPELFKEYFYTFHILNFDELEISQPANLPNDQKNFILLRDNEPIREFEASVSYRPNVINNPSAEDSMSLD